MWTRVELALMVLDCDFEDIGLGRTDADGQKSAWR
jgi:uncharacterized protein YjiS (DUF1127 family)